MTDFVDFDPGTVALLQECNHYRNALLTIRDLTLSEKPMACLIAHEALKYGSSHQLHTEGSDVAQ